MINSGKILLWGFFLNLGNLNAQSNKDLNWIFLIDEKIKITYTTPEFIVTLSNDSTYKFRSEYYPGNLSMKMEHFEQLQSNNIKSIRINILYYTIDRKQSVYHYLVNVPKGFFLERFLIFKIYNLSLRKYKKKFRPHFSNSEYAVQFESSNQQVLTPK